MDALDPIAKWGAERGLKPAKGHAKSGSGFSLTGYLGHKSWTLDCSQSSRDYIHGHELRARADLKINDDAAVLIMNRPLRDALEKRAYEMVTDTLQTIVDPQLARRNALAGDVPRSQLACHAASVLGPLCGAGRYPRARDGVG